MVNEKPVVFVIDDDESVRESLAAMVKVKGLDVETFVSGEEFLARFDRARLGCLVTDLRLCGISGVELQTRLLAEGNHLPVIIITAYADIPTVVRAIRDGALTFLEKPFREGDLWASICKAIIRHRKQREEDCRFAELKSRLARLTPDEYRVLEYLVAGKPNKAIASRLKIGLRTVELRRARILKKMEAHSVAELVRMHVTAKQYAGLSRLLEPASEPFRKNSP